MKSFDPSKFRKSITKNIEGISMGFHDPKTWISTGSFALNYLISGDFNKGIPLGKVTMFAGESGSGKSYICSGNVIRHAQEQGIFVVLFDSENALDQAWLERLGVDTSDDKLLLINVAMINDVAKIINDFMTEYKKDNREVDPEDRPKILFVIDSLGMLLTPADLDQFEKGDLKGNMGWTAKQLKALVKNCVVQMGEWEVGLLGTNHTYASQDMFDPDPKISGGSGPIFAASQVVAMNKYKLKLDEEGKKTTDVKGIRAKVKVVKSRFAKPFETVEIKIPYDTGMDPYSGLFDLFLKKGVLVKEGKKYYYKDDSVKYFEREINQNKNGILDTIMKEWDESKVSLDEIEEEEKMEEMDE